MVSAVVVVVVVFLVSADFLKCQLILKLSAVFLVCQLITTSQIL